VVVWFDENLHAGTSQWVKSIEGAIEGSIAVIPVMSTESDGSVWVDRELDLAQELRKPIVPLLLSGRCFLRLRDRQYEDVTGGRMPGADFLIQLTAPAPEIPRPVTVAPPAHGGPAAPTAPISVPPSAPTTPISVPPISAPPVAPPVSVPPKPVYPPPPATGPVYPPPGPVYPPPSQPQTYQPHAPAYPPHPQAVPAYPPPQQAAPTYPPPQPAAPAYAPPQAMQPQPAPPATPWAQQPQPGYAVPPAGQTGLVPVDRAKSWATQSMWWSLAGLCTLFTLIVAWVFAVKALNESRRTGLSINRVYVALGLAALLTGVVVVVVIYTLASGDLSSSSS
jgi:hypothetical protein